MTGMPTPRIVVVGSTMIDQIAYADRLPGDGETVVGTSTRRDSVGRVPIRR
jgi:sugar/nucleoside kinase (ribokinase family)